jgi:nitrogen-specific signal transduction histidine kinase
MTTLNTIYKDQKAFEAFLIEQQLDTNKEYLIQVFSGVIDKKELQKVSSNLYNKFPNSCIIGSTTDGEIIDGDVVTNTIVISITYFEKNKCLVNFVNYDDFDSIYSAGQALSKTICKEDTKVLICFADGLTTNGDQLLQGLASYNDKIAIAGGLSGDNAQFINTFLICNDKILENAAVAVSISGELHVSTNFNFNWMPIGKELTITNSKENIVYTIDDKSAKDTYEYYLGKDISDSLPSIGIEFPLIIKRGGISIARAVVGSNDDGSLAFAGNVNKGDVVQFGYGNSNFIIDQSSKSLHSLSKSPLETIFIYSCMARRRFIPEMIHIETKPLNKLSVVSGFFTYGEFFTNQKNSQYELLNQTMTILGLSESDTINETSNDDHFLAKNENSRTINALSHLVNITSQELREINTNLEENVKTQERMMFTQSKMASMGEMIGNIAHQWRQPLNTISTAISTATIENQLGLLSIEEFEKTADTIVRNVNYLSDTIKTFRDFLRDDKEYKSILLKEVFDQVTLITAPVLDDNHIKLETNFSATEQIAINMVSGELAQVLINIINNAKDAILENNIQNSLVQFYTEAKENNVLIFVKDNAGGIPNKILPDIFKPYFTTKDKSHGTGLGLHMSYDIIVNHMNGKIIAYNEDNGAVFCIKLPLNS